MRNTTRYLALGAALASAVLAGSLLAPAAAEAVPHQPTDPARCELPSAGEGFDQAKPSEVALDPAAVAEAIAYANTHMRLSVQIFRNNCRVAAGALDPVTDHVPYQVWSSTKSVVSILTGIAADKNRLRLDDPIDRYLPHGPGWGDRAHRAITIRQLLSQTSGLREAILAEAATTATDPNVAQEALAQPLTHRPGTHFEYSQRGPDLLAYVVERAVGEDLQDFAQRELFDPLGIPRSSYFWLRDRAGNTYGYAHLFIPPSQFAKLGLLMQNDGVWLGRRILSARYIDQVQKPSPQNGCYSLLFWTNAGKPCTGANIPNAETVNQHMIPSAPHDLYAMVGALQQNNFIIPSLNMTVTWTGVLGDTSTSLTDLLSAGPASDLYYNFFRILMRGVRDRHIPDPGPYTAPPLDFDVNPTNYADPRVLLRDIAANPRCNIVYCDGTVPTEGLVRNARSIANTRPTLPTAGAN